MAHLSHRDDVARVRSSWCVRNRHSGVCQGLNQDLFIGIQDAQTLKPESVYEALGVKFFKRYLLPTEHVARYLRGEKALRTNVAHFQADLKRLLWETRRNETLHVLGLVLSGVLLLVKWAEISAGELLAILAVNVYVNVYPIILQRYNRIRLNRLLMKCGSTRRDTGPPGEAQDAHK